MEKIAGTKYNFLSIQEVTHGFCEDLALRKRYQKKGFGLETVFEKQKWAEERIIELKQTYGLTDADIRLVNHISTSETGERPTWEIYVKVEKGLPVLFLTKDGSISEDENGI